MKNIYTFRDLIISSSVKSEHLNTREAFIKILDEDRVLLYNNIKIKMEKERLLDYLTLLELYKNGIDSFQMIFEDVYRIYVTDTNPAFCELDILAKAG